MDKRDVEKAKEILKKFDPALVMMAIQDADTKVDDVEKAKDGIRKVYESIPDTEKRSEILSKAVTEVEAEVIDKEVKNVRAAIEDIDKEALVEAAVDLEVVDPTHRLCLFHHIGCHYYNIGCYYSNIGCHYHSISCYHSSIGCHYHSIGCHYSSIGCHIFIGHECRIMLGFEHGCRAMLGLEIVVPPEEYIINPLKEELVKEVLTSPELSRAMEKMIKNMKKKGEI